MRPVAMVGRADELAELVDAWAHPSAGRGTRTVVVTGPAGTGKSLLVATVLQRLRPRPAAVLSGRARVRPHAGPAVRRPRRDPPASGPARGRRGGGGTAPGVPGTAAARGRHRGLAAYRRQPVLADRAARRRGRAGPGGAGRHAPAGAPAARRRGAGTGRRRPDRPGDRGARLPGRRHVQQAGGAPAGHLDPDGGRARVEPAAQDPVGVAPRGVRVGGTTPPAARQLTTVGPCRPPPKPWNGTSSPRASPARWTRRGTPTSATPP